MDRGTWRTTIHRATESDMTGQLSTREHRGVNEKMNKRKAYQHGKIKHSYINSYIKCKQSILNSSCKDSLSETSLVVLALWQAFSLQGWLFLRQHTSFTMRCESQQGKKENFLNSLLNYFPFIQRWQLLRTVLSNRHV